MTDDSAIPGKLWSIARIIVAVLIVCPIMFIAWLAFLVGVACDRAFYFIVRIMRVDLENL